jgi:cytochrome c oxidase cbb3-type subunit 1
VASVLLLVPVLAVVLNVRNTLKETQDVNQQPRRAEDFAPNRTSVQFIRLGVVAFVLGSLMNAAGSLARVSQITDLTWFTFAKTHLLSYGFFGLVMFGALYRIVPQITGMEFPFPRLIRLHLWVAAFGVLLIAAPLAIGGLTEGLKLQNPAIPFIDIARSILPFLHASTMGELLILIGHFIFAVNVIGLVNRFCRTETEAAFAAATADLYAGGAKS